MGKSQKIYKKAKKFIPGGTQLLSKRPEMFLPGNWPAYYKKAQGCRVTDLDNKKYYDFSLMGVGACTLGYADKDVARAVNKAVKNGSMSTLNAPEEYKLAKLLCEIHPWADMVRYSRTGGEAMSIAVRIARASTGKDLVLFCGYHGWHDWYLAANLAEDTALDGHLLPGLNPLGVPRALKGTSFPFAYNNVDEFLKLMEEHGDKVGAVVLETIRNVYPEKDFLNIIRDKTRENGVVLICDEISSGFRLNLGGAHLLFDLEPDIAVFAKGMSSGYPMSAIIGKKDIMQAAQSSFISSTYWTERIGPVAAIATIKKMKKRDVPEKLIDNGKKIQTGWKELAIKHGLDISVSGIPPLAHFEFNYDNPLECKTLFTQEMLKRGFLASTGYYASYAHKKKIIKKYLNSVDKVFSIIKEKINEGKVKESIKGEICHSGFKRLT